MARADQQRKRRQPQAASEPTEDKPLKKSPQKTNIPTANGEEDFPRGGADDLTVLERRELTEAARREVEEELADVKRPKNKKAKVSKQEDAEDAFFSRQGASLEGHLAKHVELLRLKNLRAGTKLWGMVLEVAPRGLVVSLPHGLRGHVGPSQASDVLALLLKAEAGSGGKKAAAVLEAAGGVVPPLTDLFAVGQFVRCVVSEAPEAAPAAAADGAAAPGATPRGSKHVLLSLLLRDVQGSLGAEGLVPGAAVGACVRSVEDHGYTLSFGIKGTSGFLRKKDHEAQFGEGVALQVGGLLDVVVCNAADPRNVTVSCAPGEVAAAVTGAVAAEGAAAVGLEGLLPGALLNVRVRKVLSNGLLVTFLTFFQGTIDTMHLPPAAPGAPPDWRKTYTEGAKLRARLLYVDPAAKRAGLSLLPHLMALTLPSPVPILGSVFPEAEVVRIDAGGGPGLLLTLPGLPEGPVPGYCHVSNALDERVEREAAVAELGKRFKPGTRVPARVIGYRLMDGMAAVTVRQSQVNAAVLSYADLVPGMLLQATVVSVPDRDGDGPLMLSVAEGVRGLVPRWHAAELGGGGAKLGRVKVKVGEKVEARVVEVDPTARKMTLTLRKALLGPKVKPLAAAAQAASGARFHGIVTGYNARQGVFVSFFGGLSGLAPSSQLGLEPGRDVKEAFPIGQIVKATIISSVGGRIKLSLAGKTTAAAAAKLSAQPAAPAPTTDPLGGFQPGDIAEAVVLEVHSGAAAEGAAADAVTDAAVTPAAGTYYMVRLLPEGAGGGATAGGPGVRARLEAAQLSDHPAAVAAFRGVVRPGSKLGRVVVLDRSEPQRCLRVSRKPSLLAAAAAGSLPASFEEVREGAVLPGYVASVTPDAVYVRFLGGLTGRAGLPQLSDVFVSDPRQLFSEGQSVRAQVATADAARRRFSIMLRPSATASTDGAFLLDYFRDLQQLQRLRTEAEAATSGAAAPAAASPDASDPTRLFPLGSVVGAAVHEVKEYGIVCDLDDHPDLVGLVPSSHLPAPGGAPPPLGSRVRGRVLDVAGHQGLVEISLRPDMVAAGEATAEGAGGNKEKKGKEKKGKDKEEQPAAEAVAKLKSGLSVQAVVEGIRPGEYLILSLPQHAYALAYAALTDYNTPRPDLVHRTFTVGQKITATVAALPPDAPAGRIVCHVPLTRAAAKAAEAAAAASGAGAGAAAGDKKQKMTPGSVVQAVVTALHPHQLDVSIGGGKAKGRIHVTEVVDVDVSSLLAAAKAAEAAAVGGNATAAAAVAPPTTKKARKAGSDAVPAAVAPANGAIPPSRNPLDGFRLQQTVEAVVLGRLLGGEGHRKGVMDLSLRPSRLAVAKKGEPQVPHIILTDLVAGQQLPCVVLEVAEDALWLAAGPAVRGRCAVLDASLDPSVLSALPQHFPPGTPVIARVLAVNGKKRTLDLSLIDPCCGTTHGSIGGKLPAEGSLVMGRIVAAGAAAAGGLRLALGPKLTGKVAMTDIHDGWVVNALAGPGLTEGSFVRARVLGSDGTTAVLSLRPSRGGAVAAPTAGEQKAGTGAEEGGDAAPELLDAAALKSGQMVAGYVKRCDAKGLFVALDRHHDGRIKLGNLSDGFIEDPPAAFPPGMRLEARLIGVAEDGKVELSMRTPKRAPSQPSIKSLSDLAVGQLVPGRVRRVEKFGVFVEVAGNRSVVGLAHISELADGPVKGINAAFKAKQAVRALVTKVDLEASRLSLSMKPSRLKEADKDAQAGEGGVGSKRRRGADIDEEIAAAADEEKEEASDSDDDRAEDDDGSTGGEEEAALGSDVDVDDVEVSEEGEEDGDEEMEEVGEGEDEEEESGGSEEGEEKEGDGERPGALGRSRPGTTSTGDLDLTAPWGELLLADDPRAGRGNAGEGGAGDGEEDGGKKLSKGQKKRMKEDREKEIRAAELARLSGSSAPTTAADFERLVLASPSSSFVWIKYMALHVSRGDVDAARKVAQRALGSINYREEGEKFNVWVAWLNLENAYGTSPSPEEAAMGLLRRALQYTDPKKMYLAALGVFERSDREELCEQVLKTLTKKFGGSAKVWARAIERALQKGDGESARKLLERSLQSLPARKHVKSLVRAALAEFRLGSAERGRGILEGVLRNYPKRLDLWSVYIDQELKTGEQPRIRALFERATHLPLPPKKMKFLFRRYLEYEKAEGDAAAVEHVKRRAMEFVESSLKA